MKSISILNKSNDCVLIEGYLGELEEVGLIEGIMLEIRGTNGTFRMDLNEQELQKLLKKKEKNQEKTTNEKLCALALRRWNLSY